VLPSGERLDMNLVRDVLDDPEATLAREDEITHDFGGFELGALPPIAPLLGVDTVVDPTVKDHGPVVFAGGTQTESVKVDAEELFSFQPVRFLQVAEVWNEGRA
jgi:prolyl-tRNA editing enzyme YbaK/EbsC (Cys-tRNA(Pro) deacylase)